MFFRFAPPQSWQDKIFERVFKNRKVCEEKLLPFGFVRGEHGFSYGTELLNGLFRIKFDLHADGSLNVELHGIDGNESHTRLLTQKSPSSLLGKKLRKEYEEELWHVAECCFEPDTFKGESTRQVIAHIKEVYGDELEYLWRKFPGNAIVRRQDNAKWYAAFLTVPRSKLGDDSAEMVEILNLRVRPEDLDEIVDHQSRFPGYHMNKKNWVTLCLDGSVPLAELAERLEMSCGLARK